MSQWVWQKFDGPDASDFLHRLSTVDMKRLSTGTGAHGLFLGATGKILFRFYIWKTGSQAYAFEYDGGTNATRVQTLTDLIERYRFSERLTLHPPEPFHAHWRFDLANQSALSLDSSPEEWTTHHGTLEFGRPWSIKWSRLSKRPTDLPPLPDSKTLNRWRVESVRPAEDSEISPSVGPLEIGLQDAIARNKGCYPGQEVIERTFTYGSPAYRLGLFSSEHPMPPGTPIRTNENPNPVTVVTSSTESPPYLALGSVSKVLAHEGSFFLLPGGGQVKLVQISPYAP